MLKKLRTVVYQVDDLEKAKDWYGRVFNITPYFDEAFYVGYDIGGFELGLHPGERNGTNAGAAVSYWLVNDVQAGFDQLMANGAGVHEKPNDTGGGVTVASVSDPFGNVIGLISIPGE